MVSGIHAPMSEFDPRTPNPPLGYSRPCELTENRQIELVAEFHAFRIRPSRIAYRLGIDISFIDTLLAGERESRRFTALVKYYRGSRFRSRVTAAEQVKGQRGYELRQTASRDFENEAEI